MKLSQELLNLLVLNAILGDRSTNPSACKVCGNTGKNPTGECHMCGAYQCADCKLYHLGDATKLCPGNGVSIPEKYR